MPSLSSLVNEKEKSIEFKKYRTNNLFLSSLMIYNENYNELLKEIVKHEQTEFRPLFKSSSGLKKFYKLQDRITRYMHNYLASAFTLIRTTKSYYDKFYKPYDKLSEYETKVESEINSKPIKHFTMELRNFMQHNRVPHLFTTTSYKDTGFYESFVHYKYEDLMQSDSWNSKSKLYLNEHKTEIRLKNVIEEYNSLIQHFYDWFLNETEKDLENDSVYLNNLDESIRIERFRRYLRILLPSNQTKVQFEKSLYLYLTSKEKKMLEKQHDNIKRLSILLKILNSYEIVNDKQVDEIKNIYK